MVLGLIFSIIGFMERKENDFGVVNECDDMGLGEQVILSDKKSKGGQWTMNILNNQIEWKTYDTQMTVTFEDSVKVESISKGMNVING